MADLDSLILEAKRVSKEYRRLTGRALGATGELGEQQAARLLSLRLCEPGQKGYDALRGAPGKKERVQIKTRCRTESTGRQKLGRLDVKQEWDIVSLVILDGDYEVQRIREARRPEIVAALEAPGSVSRNKRGRLSLAQFVTLSCVIWERGGLSR